MKCVDATEVMRLFAGQLGPERSELLAAHFTRCAACASLRDDMVRLTTALEAEPDAFRDDRAVDEVMALIRMGKADKPDLRAPASFWRSWQTWVLVPGTAAATALLMLSLRGEPSPAAEPGFQARGAELESPDAWVSLQVYRAAAQGYEPVHDGFAADDSLAFSYLNRSDGRLRYLAVLGLDAHGKIFWYYPPAGEAASRSVPIESTHEPRELPEQVAHELASGPYRIFAVFSREGLSMRELELAVRQGFERAGTVDRMGRLPLDDVGQHSLLFSVRPASHGGQPP